MRKFDSINVIPFIDIMLVLLAIVLTTASFINHGQLEITLPNAVSDSEYTITENTEIAIDSQSIIYLDEKAITLDQLKSELSSLAVNTSILLRIDESVPFHQFVSVIDLLKQLQLDDVSVLTEKTNQVNPKAGAGTSASGTEN